MFKDRFLFVDLFLITDYLFLLRLERVGIVRIDECRLQLVALLYPFAKKDTPGDRHDLVSSRGIEE